MPRAIACIPLSPSHLCPEQPTITSMASGPAPRSSEPDRDEPQSPAHPVWREQEAIGTSDVTEQLSRSQGSDGDARQSNMSSSGHDYLPGLESVRASSTLHDLTVHDLPVLPLLGIVLCPFETIPLIERDVERSRCVLARDVLL